MVDREKLKTRVQDALKEIDNVLLLGAAAGFGLGEIATIRKVMTFLEGNTETLPEESALSLLEFMESGEMWRLLGDMKAAATAGASMAAFEAQMGQLGIPDDDEGTNSDPSEKEH